MAIVVQRLRVVNLPKPSLITEPVKVVDMIRISK
jgi:hypothetical protein